MTPAFSIKVLLIEDNPEDARLIEMMLRRSKEPRFEVRISRTLAAGLTVLSSQGADLVLLDLTLPDSEGIETLKRVMDLSARPPVIVVTGLDERELAVKAIEYGATDYLVKDRVDWLLLARILVRHLAAAVKA